jgi:hypothetical protein
MGKKDILRYLPFFSNRAFFTTLGDDYLKVDVKDMAGNVYPPDNCINEKK